MNNNAIDWYEFIVNNHFKERNITPPSFFTRYFVAFKLPDTPHPPKSTRDKKVFETKQRIYNEIKTMPTSQLIHLICDTSFIHL